MAAKTAAPRPRTTPGARTPAPRKAAAKAVVPAAVFAAPIETVDVELARTVNGLRVVDDRPHRDAAGRLQTRFRALTLSDGSKVIGCSECNEAGEYITVLHHRQEKHGDRRSGRRAGGGAAAPTPVPTVNVLGMTVGELMNLASQIEAWEATTDRLTAERDRAISRATAAETELKALKKQQAKAAALLGGTS
jgi:hypothetical protein